MNEYVYEILGVEVSEEVAREVYEELKEYFNKSNVWITRDGHPVPYEV